MYVPNNADTILSINESIEMLIGNGLKGFKTIPMPAHQCLYKKAELQQVPGTYKFRYYMYS